MLIPYAKQSIDKVDIKNVTKALKSEFITQGKLTEKFEKKISNYVKSKYACVVNSATSGLFLACKLLNLSKQDWVWTTSNTFVSTANVIEHAKGNVDLLDINHDGNLCIDYLKKKLKKTRKNKLPKAIIAVHIAGLPCDMKELFKLKKKYKFKIIEDASHALGASIDNNRIGSCNYSDFCVFSFHAIKSITTGEGGCVTTNNKNDFLRLCQLRSHGVVREKNLLKKKSLSRYHWYYEVNEISFNFRLTDFQSALGISQLQKLNRFIKLRTQIAKNYLSKLDNKKFILPKLYKNKKSSWHLFIIKTKKTMKRSELYDYLKSKGIISVLHYIPIFKHPYYKKKIKNKNKFINSNIYFKRALSIPIFPNLNKKKQDYIIKTLNNFS